MDKVYIRELRLETVIGVYAWEREIRQEIVIDLEMAWDNRPAAAGDDLTRALDYAAVAGRIAEVVQASQFQLIESLAERIATLVLEEFKVTWLRLDLAKPGAVPQARDVGVVIERGVSG